MDESFHTMNLHESNRKAYCTWFGQIAVSEIDGRSVTSHDCASMHP
jgi:hypothetical protein